MAALLAFLGQIKEFATSGVKTSLEECLPVAGRVRRAPGVRLRRNARFGRGFDEKNNWNRDHRPGARTDVIPDVVSVLGPG